MRCVPGPARGRAASDPARRRRQDRRRVRWRREARRGRRAGRRSGGGAGRASPASSRTSVSTNAISGVSTAPRPALRATAGPAFVRSRSTREPGTAVTGGSDASSTAITAATPGQQRTISASADSPSTNAGTTTVTSAAVNGPSTGRGWIAPASTRRSTRRSVFGSGATSSPLAMSSKTATPASVRRKSRSGDPPMTTLLPGGRRVVASSVNVVIERTLPPARARRRRAASRSSTRARSSAAPSAADAPAGSPSTPFGGDGAHAAGAQAGADRGQRRRLAGRGAIEPHEVGADRQQQRRLGAAGVGVAAGDPRPPGQGRIGPRRRVDAVARSTASRLPPWPLTSTTPAAQSADRTSSTITAAVVSVPSDSVPGKPACSPLAVTVSDGPTVVRPSAGGEAGGDGLGDDRVGGQRQVRAVLLARADRDAQDRPARPRQATSPPTAAWIDRIRWPRLGWQAPAVWQVPRALDLERTRGRTVRRHAGDPSRPLRPSRRPPAGRSPRPPSWP